MRRLMVIVPILALLVLAPAACKRRKRVRPTPLADEAPMVSVLNVADPRAERQLTRGFHGIEQDAWRWTAKNFAVTLRRPLGADQTGASLELKFTVPEAIFNRVGAVTLNAKVNGESLRPETFSKGDATYTRDVLAKLLTEDTVVVEFTADKGLPPGTDDARELAVIVSAISLTAK